MISLGINKGATRYGKILKDGGAAIISDDIIVSAISEERLTLAKGASGFEKAVPYLLKNADLKLSDIDIVIYSSCCEFNPEIDNSLTKLIPGTNIVRCPSHHFSHALSAYFTSGFDEAIIIVNDSGGDVLEKMSDTSWWRYDREQASYFIGRGNSVEKVGVDFENPREAGIGEIFRAFTKYLGWDTKYTGKVMSLAGTVTESRFANIPIWDFAKNGKIFSSIENSPLSPVSMITSFVSGKKTDLPPQRSNQLPITNEHKELAFWIQSQYEKIICQKAQNLKEKYGIKNLCLSGGVALNCIANSKILANTEIEKIFIPPAAGDQGQCLGNAIYGINYLGIKKYYSSFSPYQSPKQIIQNNEIVSNENFLQHFELITLKRPEVAIATLLTSNKLIGHFYGRGEFGPRALGHRSIFASPINVSIKERLNQIKKREKFNPFACTILESHYSEWFHNSAENSKYMLLADKIRIEMQAKVPAIVHSDGTSRIQTVSYSDCPRVYEILNHFFLLTGVPLILNTSLNTNNQPICESVSSALKSFEDLKLDCLVINDYLIFSKFNREDILSIIETLI
jgi:carbamoyltransferase